MSLTVERYELKMRLKEIDRELDELEKEASLLASSASLLITERGLIEGKRFELLHKKHETDEGFTLEEQEELDFLNSIFN